MLPMISVRSLTVGLALSEDYRAASGRPNFDKRFRALV